MQMMMMMMMMRMMTKPCDNDNRKMADISQLLDVEDMVRMKSPDWKCVFTYVQMFYRRFALQPKQNSTAKVEMNSTGDVVDTDAY